VNPGRRRFTAAPFPRLCGRKFVLNFLNYAAGKIIGFGLGGFAVERGVPALGR